MSSAVEVADPERLAAVARIKPIAEDARDGLERLAELAAQVMDAPTGFVSLVGAERLHLVAVVGAGRRLSAVRRLAAPDGGFPFAALVAGEVVFIDGVVEAPRLAKDWGAAPAWLPACAAIPFRDPAGHVIGALGVGDTHRRRWRPSACKALPTVARSVERELALLDGKGWQALSVSSEGLERRAGRQEVLARGTAAVHRSLNPDAELRALGWAAVPQLADMSGVHRLVHPVPVGLLPPMPVVSDLVVAAAYPDLPDMDGRRRWGRGSPVVEAVRTGAASQQALDVHNPPGWARDVGLADMIRSGLHHVAAAPVIVDELAVAVVVYWRRANLPPWTGDDLRVLGQLAEHAGRALAHGLSYQRTRETALTLQRSLLTEPQVIRGLDIRVRYRPAGTDEVGGDWYDTLLLDDDTLAITVGDVVGHDITAAAAMGQMRATLRSILALDLADDPSDVLRCLDTATQRLRITSFATVVHGKLQRIADQWQLRWASAGHPPPLLLTDEAEPCWLDQAEGMVIGTGLPQAGRSSAAATLHPGDSLLLYTDGLFERHKESEDDELAHLAALAAAHRRQPLDTLCDILLDDAATDDDVVILAIRATDT